MSPTAVVTAFGKSPRRVVDGGGGWREREGVGEVKSEQIEARMMNLWYLRLRGSMAELRDASATVLEH